jgi:hypothetical protein
MEHIEDCLNRHIIWEINPDFEFAFTGLNAKEESKQRQAWEEESKSYKMIDEVRAEMDLEPLPDGSGQVVRDPVWLQAKQGAEQMAQGEEEQGGEGEGPLDELPGDDEGENEFEDEFGGDEFEDGDQENADDGSAFGDENKDGDGDGEKPNPFEEKADDDDDRNDVKKAVDAALAPLQGLVPIEPLIKARVTRKRHKDKQIIRIDLGER